MKGPVLLTGFGPFGDTRVNPAQSVVEMLQGQSVAGSAICGLVIENNFEHSVVDVVTGIEKLSPRAVIMLGEYGGRALVTVERIATNWDDSARYGLRDNAGVQRAGAPSVPDGPVALASTAPVRSMVAAMRAVGVPADLSDTPGTFVCNHLFYGVLYVAAQRWPSLPIAWIHLPHLPEVAATEENLGAPSMAASTSAAAVTAGIAAVLNHQRDQTPEPAIRTRWQI